MYIYAYIHIHTYICVCVDGWMDGWMDGWIGRMDGWDGWICISCKGEAFKLLFTLRVYCTDLQLTPIPVGLLPSQVPLTIQRGTLGLLHR